MVWVKMSKWLRLRDLCCHGDNNKHLEQWQTCFKKISFGLQQETNSSLPSLSSGFLHGHGNNEHLLCSRK